MLIVMPTCNQHCSMSCGFILCYAAACAEATAMSARPAEWVWAWLAEGGVSPLLMEHEMGGSGLMSPPNARRWHWLPVSPDDDPTQWAQADIWERQPLPGGTPSPPCYRCLSLPLTALNSPPSHPCVSSPLRLLYHHFSPTPPCMSPYHPPCPHQPSLVSLLTSHQLP